MPCFWAGFIGSREPGCSGDTPPPDPCDGIGDPPTQLDIEGSTGCIPGGVSWAPVEGGLPAGYNVVSGLGCIAGTTPPTSVVLVRKCDATEFVVPVGDADIICC
jgi:hypothetical protein